MLCIWWGERARASLPTAPQTIERDPVNNGKDTLTNWFKRAARLLAVALIIPSGILVGSSLVRASGLIWYDVPYSWSNASLQPSESSDLCIVYPNSYVGSLSFNQWVAWYGYYDQQIVYVDDIGVYDATWSKDTQMPLYWALIYLQGTGGLVWQAPLVPLSKRFTIWDFWLSPDANVAYDNNGYHTGYPVQFRARFANSSNNVNCRFDEGILGWGPIP
jgi:hypothetical protein